MVQGFGVVQGFGLHRCGMERGPGFGELFVYIHMEKETEDLIKKYTYKSV